MKKKIVKYYNDRYRGSLVPEDCEKLEQIIELDKNNGCFSDLRHIIYELSDDDVQAIISETEKYGIVQSPIDYKYGTMRDEQTLGTAFMYFAKRCILGDSVGLGKTIESAGLIQILSNEYRNAGKKFNWLLLTEKNLVEQTRAKMIKFTGKYVETVQGTKPSCQKFMDKYPCGNGLEYGVVGSHTLFTQELFLVWMNMAKSVGDGFPFDLIIVDESSVLGNLATSISKSAKAILPMFSRAIFLNATPFESKLDVFYSQLALLDEELLPTKTNFQKEYVVFDYRGMYPKPTGKYKNQASFRRLVGYRYFARTRRDKGAIMQDCTGDLFISPLSEVQKYWLKRTQMPQIVYDCPNALDQTITFDTYNVPKLESLWKALTVDFEDAVTVLIFVHYREAQDSLSSWLTDRGYSNRVLCGETKDADREAIIRGFKNAEFRILITNVQKGLDFGDCDHCIFYSFDPNPSKMVQFEGRITRSFDIIGKHIILLCSEGRELDRLNNVIKGRAKSATEFTNVDLSCIMDLLMSQ